MKAPPLSSCLLLTAASLLVPVNAGHKKNCKDDDDFKFKSQYVGKKDCEWLSDNEDRQEKYCKTKGWDGNSSKKVKFFCQKSCKDYRDKCDNNFMKCDDDEDFKFKTEHVGKKDCEWLSEKEDKAYKYCEHRGWDGEAEKKVKYACKDTCIDFLDGDSFKHCKSESLSPVPSVIPSVAPSISPSSLPSEYEKKKKTCKDDNSFKFETEFVGVEDCKWLSEKPKRKYKYCEGQGWDGKADTKVKYACKRSCANFLEGDQFDKCDKFEDDDYVADLRPDDDNAVDCKNEKKFRFKTEFSGKRKCSWLTNEDRKEKYCDTRGWDDNAEKKVKYACQASCGCL